MAEELLRYSIDLNGSITNGIAGKANNIKLFFFDYDGKQVDGITIAQAEKIAELDPDIKFYFVDGDGETQEYTIEEVKKLDPIKATTPSNTGESSCSKKAGPQTCGPPKVSFDVIGGGIAPKANAIVSPTSSSIIAFDIVSPGSQLSAPPRVNINDECGNGDGANARAVTRPSPTNPQKQEIQRIVVTSPGNGYLPYPNGSTGGSGAVFTNPGQCYVITAQGTYYSVKPGSNPILNEGDELICPQPPPTPQSPEFIPPNPYVAVPNSPVRPVYKVALAIDVIEVVRPGFGYKPTDKIVIEPANGAKLNPVYTDTGELNRVEVLDPGIGFDDFPVIYIESDSGYNAELIPVFKTIREEEIPIEVSPDITLISVIDCVGKV